jgi:tRNA dimethylallyltransferase
MKLFRSILKKFVGEKEKPKVLIIGGPTASGKTKISIEIAKILNGEVINCDSLQFYKELNVGSNKSIDQSIPHHLFDILSINDKETLPSGEFSKIARELINEIHSRKKIPICVGGSGFYIQNLIYGAPSNPKSSLNNRENLVHELKIMGWEKG